MPSFDHNLTKIVRLIAATIAIIVAISLPLGYWTLSYEFEASTAGTAAEVHAALLTKRINANPVMWRYELPRLGALLAENLTPGRLPEKRLILDEHGAVLAQSQGPLAAPVLTRSAELFDSGQVVGHFVVSRSLVPVVQHTGLTLLFALALALGVYVSLRVLPLRALERALSVLRHEQERRRVIVDNAMDGIITVDRNGVLESFNPAAERMFGCCSSEMMGHHLDEIMHGLAAADSPTGPGSYTDMQETVGRRRDGTTFPVELSTSRAVLEGGTKFIIVARDITDRHQAEAAVRESEARFRLLIEKSLAGMYVSRGGCLAYANPRLEQILGCGPGELIGLNLDDLALAEDLPIMNAARQELKTEAYSATISVRFRRKDGVVVELGLQEVMADFEGTYAAIGMAQDIGERNRAQAEIEHYIARLEHTMEGTLRAVALMVEQRDPYTAGHQRRVGELAAAIGTEMGLSEECVKGLRLTGYVHDIGKISVPAELLSKPTRLSSMEFELIKNHGQNGCDVLKDVDFPWPLAEVILQHHERLDGSGYPRQLKGGQIFLEARILSVADVVEAMSSHRPYRPSMGLEAALGEIEINSGKFYDLQVVEACLRLFREKAYVLPA